MGLRHRKAMEKEIFRGSLNLMQVLNSLNGQIFTPMRQVG